MNRTEEYIDNKSQLCKNCIYGFQSKTGTIKCLKTKQPPDYNFFCPQYKLHKTKDNYYKNFLRDAFGKKKIDKKLVELFPFLNHYVRKRIILGMKIVFLLVIFFVLMIISHIDAISGSVFFNVLLSSFYVLIFSLFQMKSTRIKFKSAFLSPSLFFHVMPNSILGVYYKMPYFYMVLAFDVYHKKKNSSQNDLKIIEQNIIRLFSPSFLKYAKYLLNNGLNIEINDPKFIEKIGKLNEEFKKILFSELAELLIYNNLSDSNLYDLYNLLNDKYLNLNEKFVKEKIQKYVFLEKERIKELEQQKQEEKHRQERKKRDYNIISQKRNDYYSILELNSSASKDEIKKKFKNLALKFHPDRLIFASETEQLFAEKKFKEISEAYNYIRKERGF